MTKQSKHRRRSTSSASPQTMAPTSMNDISSSHSAPLTTPPSNGLFRPSVGSPTRSRSLIRKPLRLENRMGKDVTSHPRTSRSDSHVSTSRRPVATQARIGSLPSVTRATVRREQKPTPLRLSPNGGDEPYSVEPTRNRRVFLPTKARPSTPIDISKDGNTDSTTSHATQDHKTFQPYLSIIHQQQPKVVDHQIRTAIAPHTGRQGLTRHIRSSNEGSNAQQARRKDKLSQRNTTQPLSGHVEPFSEGTYSDLKARLPLPTNLEAEIAREQVAALSCALDNVFLGLPAGTSSQTLAGATFINSNVTINCNNDSVNLAPPSHRTPDLSSSLQPHPDVSSKESPSLTATSPPAPPSLPPGPSLPAPPPPPPPQLLQSPDKTSTRISPPSPRPIALPTPQVIAVATTWIPLARKTFEVNKPVLHDLLLIELRERKARDSLERQARIANGEEILDVEAQIVAAREATIKQRLNETQSGRAMDWGRRAKWKKPVMPTLPEVKTGSEEHHQADSDRHEAELPITETRNSG